MKISKSYLKQIIKEEIQHLHENDGTQETIIKMKPSDYLSLTTGINPATGVEFLISDLEARYIFRMKEFGFLETDKDGKITKYDDQKINQFFDGLKTPSLVIDFNGTVKNHEGRMRMYHYQKYRGNQPKDVIIYHPKGLDLSKSELMLHNQLGTDTSVQLNKQQQKDIDLSQIDELVNLTPDSFSGKMRDIVSKLVKEKNISKEEAANLLNVELQKYDVIVEPTREQEFAVMIVTSPMVSARIYKKDYREGSILNDPKSKQFSNPLSYKDKITLRK